MILFIDMDELLELEDRGLCRTFLLDQMILNGYLSLDNWVAITFDENFKEKILKENLPFFIDGDFIIYYEMNITIIEIQQRYRLLSFITKLMTEKINKDHIKFIYSFYNNEDNSILNNDCSLLQSLVFQNELEGERFKLKIQKKIYDFSLRGIIDILPHKVFISSKLLNQISPDHQKQLLPTFL